MLNVKELRIHYGVAEVIKGISMTAEEGEIGSLIGANGAGKTTILRTISGLKRCTSGEIWFMGQRIDGLAKYEIVSLGVAHCPEGRRLFHSMSVIDNLLLGAFLRKDKKEISGDLERMYGHFPILKERSKQLAGSLSGGEQQMVAIGRALMSKPKLLLMDEPSLGLSPMLVSEVERIIRSINTAGVGIILVEQNAHIALRLSKKVYVLEMGKITVEGTSSTLAQDEHIKKAYFGRN